MSAPRVVSNSSPLIALDQIGHLDLLQQLFGDVLVPPAVVRETMPMLILPAWIKQQSLTQAMNPRVLAASIGPGEQEAICLALDCGAAWIILDDRPARRLATALGLPMIGTLGVLLAAKRRGLLVEIRTSLDELIQHGFHVSSHLYDQVLLQAGETPELGS